MADENSDEVCKQWMTSRNPSFYRIQRYNIHICVVAGAAIPSFSHTRSRTSRTTHHRNVSSWDSSFVSRGDRVLWVGLPLLHLRLRQRSAYIIRTVEPENQLSLDWGRWNSWRSACLYRCCPSLVLGLDEGSPRYQSAINAPRHSAEGALRSFAMIMMLTL